MLSGFAAGIIGVGAREINGVSLGLIVGSERYKGLSVAAFNRSKNLRGVQVGLINYAGNNPKLLRWLPLLNVHLGKPRPDGRGKG